MQRRGLYRQGDTDSSGDTPTSFSPDVFANGGPTLGGAIADVLGLSDTIGISDAEARSIIEGIAAEQAVGNDPYINEPLEQYEISPITGQPSGAAPGSDASTGADADVDDQRCTSYFRMDYSPTHAKCNPRVLPDVWTKLETFAKSH